MASRGFQIVVVVFWLASMTWLAITKIVPLLVSGERPDYLAALPATPDKVEIVGWDLMLGHRPLGWAVNRSERLADGAGVLESVVHFDQLPISQLLEQSLPLLKTITPSGQLDITPGWEMTIQSRAELHPNRRLHQLQTRVDFGPLKNAIRLDGRVEENKLRLQVAVATSGETDSHLRQNKLIEREFDFAGDDVIADALAPQPRLDRLRVGQTWTIRSYQLIPPPPAMQVIEARVESDDFITWDDQPVHVKVVAYRAEAGTGLSTTREPIVRLWVAEDGLVVRQEALLAGQRFVLVRMTHKKLESIHSRFKEYLSVGTTTP